MPPVRAHVYDLSSVWQTINASVPSMQAYHVGVEVFGREYTFQFIFDDDHPDGTGVVTCRPTKAASYIFKESLELGETTLTEKEFRSLMNRLADEWLSRSYHPIHKNCVDFSRALISELKVEGQLPDWVASAADTSKAGGVVGWLAEQSWSGLKWYYGIQDEIPTSTEPQDVSK